MIRTYPLKHSINRGKQQKIMAVARAYRKLAVKLARVQWREFYRRGEFDRNLDIKEVASELSARYKQTCQYQVVSVLKSFIANRQNEFVKTVWQSSLDDRSKLEFFYINKYHLWFASSAAMPARDDKGKIIENQEWVAVSAQTIRLARAIFKHVLQRHRKPRLQRCNLALDNKVAQINKRQDNLERAAHKFAYWITFSTLEPRKQIYLPLTSNAYFEEKTGEVKKFCQLNIGNDGRLGVCLVKDVEKTAYVAQTPKISLDFGLRNLFASQNGDLYGRNFIEMLKKYDGYISPLASNRQRQGLLIKSRAYNSLISHLRNFLKNEINRVLNRIITNYQPKEIVVEHLDFTSPDLSRRLNRLLSNMGRKLIQEKFDSLKQEFGIVITEVPAPYSSQECSRCGYVDKLNRTSQAVFICRHCHKKLHADVNSSRNLFTRSSSKQLSNVYLSKSTILDILVAQFLQHYPHSVTCASALLHKNPYFQQRPQCDTCDKPEDG
jgi:putative transposase